VRHWHCSFGFNFPIVVDANDIVVAGHARLKAALRLELPEVPVVRVDHLTPAEVKALRLADNRLAEEAS
jgi:ParB-like chromosome segregation protein Spo0J